MRWELRVSWETSSFSRLLKPYGQQPHPIETALGGQVLTEVSSLGGRLALFSAREGIFFMGGVIL
jgi:hypothetical protein